jgi:hypothetical protein
MKIKKCIACNIEKVISEYYKHGQMLDGHLNKCKECCKIQSNKRYSKLYENKEFVESERQRQKEKYKRLGYYSKHKDSTIKRPWKNSVIYKGLHKKLKCEKGHELHHWNYNERYLEDVIVLPISIHRKIHKKLKLDLDKKIFIYQNEYLDTLEKHKIAIEKILEICI